MQIVNTTIVTTVAEIKELIQHCIIHNFEGQINLTFEDSKILVSEPSKEINPELEEEYTGPLVKVKFLALPDKSNQVVPEPG